MLTLSLLIILALGFGIGASLGLLGGGGSILTVPALVYVVGQSPQVAIATSLAIVGANSGLGPGSTCSRARSSGRSHCSLAQPEWSQLILRRRFRATCPAVFCSSRSPG